MKIAIYSRKSKFTGKGESIENQIELCRQYIRLHFDHISDTDMLVYEDEGFSGGNTDRPQFQKMMADAECKRFCALVCYRLDRISRNIGDFSKLIEELNALSISFISIREQFDTDSPMGRAMMYIASVFSQLERETTAERIRDNMRELAKTGRWLGGTAPTGYRSKAVEKVAADGRTRRAFRLVFQPDEIETVKLLFKKFLETASLTKIETYLIQNNILTKNGKRFTRFTIKGILENPVYMTADRDAYRYFAGCGVELCAKEKDFDGSRGIMAYNKTLQRHGKTNRARGKEDWIVAIGKHRGILSGEKWIRVQELLEQNRSKSYRRPKSSVALLAGLLRCAGCGSYMRPKLTQRKNAAGEPIYTYLCELKEKSHGFNCSARNVNGNVLDRAVCSEIRKLPEDGSAFRRQIRSNRQFSANCRTGDDTELDRLKKSLRKNEAAISNYIAALAKTNGSPSGDYITKQINELHEKNSRLKSRIKELECRINTRRLSETQIDGIESVLRSFASAFDTMTADKKQVALRTLIDKIVWDGNDIHIYFPGTGTKMPPSSAETTVGRVPQREDCK